MTGRKDRTMAPSTTRIPLYLASPEYARDNGELDQYRESFHANRACARDIERMIAKHFDGMHLDSDAIIKDIMKRHAVKRICLLLALTLRDKSYDGRFSRSNIAWAGSFDIPDHMLDPGRIPFNTLSTHPAVLDGFVSQFRKAIGPLGL